jgi:cation diffusion facilitator family transporter
VSSERGAAHYAWLSVATALVTMALKFGAWHVTGSVGLLSDALESFVNLGGALMLLWMVRLAALPADAGHPYGHGKAEYFASAFEGLLIAIAAVSIAWAAAPRLLEPRPIAAPALGLVISSVAALVNGAVAVVLLRAGKRLRSVALEADGHHLLTDVWTSAAVLVAVALVALTGWLLLDPLIAIAVAINILWTGWRLVRSSVEGLMDAVWPPEDLMALEQILDGYRAQGLAFHALRTRRAGARRFASMHVLVPGAWSVQRAHDLVEEIERRAHERLAPVTLETHIEPIEDPASGDDVELDRSFRGSHNRRA